VRVEVRHPYFAARLAQNAASTGLFVKLDPDEAMTLAMLRLVGGIPANEFLDHLAAELALFEFVITCERRAQRVLTAHEDDARLLHEVRRLVIDGLPKAVDISSVAERFGLSRSHFSRYFRVRTGKTPGHFATLVRLERAQSMLLETNANLRLIAGSCGFANANHLCKVFRRIRNCSPNAFRQSHGMFAAWQPG
jgi:transcriptional regulator GlxA family with amidase domain